MHLKLQYSSLKVFAFTYIAIPILLFSIGYLKVLYALVVTIAICYGMYSGLRNPNTNPNRDKCVEISLVQLLSLLGIILLWTYMGGLNGYFYQSDDWDARNAIFRDMITHEWPVTYNNGSALAYYIAFWMPAAAVGRLFYVITGSLELAWFLGNNALWIWSAAGLFLTLLLLIVYLDAESAFKQFFVALIFIFFSGLDFVGVALQNGYEKFFAPDYLHLEWWDEARQFSSITTCLYWVFNQSIIPWLCVMCFLFEKNAANYLLIGTGCLASGPFPFVGLVLCMASRWCGELITSIKQKRLKETIKTTFSLQNVVVLLAVFSFLAIFFMSNNAFSDSIDNSQPSIGLTERLQAYLTPKFLLFLAIEVGLYLVVLWYRNRENLLYYAVAVLCVVLPYFRIGASADFCMRATIPCIFILMVMCAEAVIDGIDTFRADGFCKRLSLILLSGLLCVGSITPAVEIYRGIYNVVVNGTIALPKDTIGTFDTWDVTYNFSTGCYPESFFFKHFAPTTHRILMRYESGFSQPVFDGEIISRQSEMSAVLSIYNDSGADFDGYIYVTISPVAGKQAKMDGIRVEITGESTDFFIGKSGGELYLPLSVVKNGKSGVRFTAICGEQIVEDAFVLTNVRYEDSAGVLVSGAFVDENGAGEINVINE